MYEGIEMRKMFKGKGKLLFVAFFVLLTLTGCSAPRGRDGKTKVDKIIANEQVTFKKSEVNVEEIKDEKLKKEYSKLKENDDIVIKPMSWKDAWSNGWFDGLIVWPLATLINLVAKKADAGIGIIVATVLIQGLVFIFTRKSQESTQRMQEIQPDIQKIQAKYAGRNDQDSQMKMYQETQALYKKYDIHPLGSILVLFIQMPIMMGMYYATVRAASVIHGTFMGIRLEQTPMEAFKTGTIGIIVIYILMVILQFVTTQLPNWLRKSREKAQGKKEHAYRKEEQGNMANSMQTSMYMMTVMFAFIYIGWPAAMSFYWCVSSIIRIAQSLFIHKTSAQV